MDSEAVAREMLRAFNENDWEAFRATLADGFVYREHGTGRDASGADAAVELIRGWKDGLGPEHHGELVDVMACGERCALQVVWRAHHVGPMPAPDGSMIAPTNRPVATPACMAMTMADGRIAVMDHYFDSLALMLSIGGVTAGPAR
jgi:ketosteroid isomerase-like protein